MSVTRKSIVRNGRHESASGDNETLVVKLFKPGVTITDWSREIVYCFGKLDLNDTDEEAVFQKFTGSGITVIDGSAHIEMVPFDTVEQSLATIHVGLRSENIDDGSRTNFDGFDWVLGKPAVQHTDASITIYTTTAPASDPYPIRTTPETGDTLSNDVSEPGIIAKSIQHIVTPAAALDELTIPLYPDLLNMRVFALVSTQDITTPTVVWGGVILGDELTTIVANWLYSWQRIDDTTFLRIS